MVRVVNPEQPPKAETPIDATELPIVTDVILPHLKKRKEGMFCTELPITTDALHPTNAPFKHSTLLNKHSALNIPSNTSSNTYEQFSAL